MPVTFWGFPFLYNAGLSFKRRTAGKKGFSKLAILSMTRAERALGSQAAWSLVRAATSYSNALRKVSHPKLQPPHESTRVSGGAQKPEGKDAINLKDHF